MLTNATNDLRGHSAVDASTAGRDEPGKAGWTGKSAGAPDTEERVGRASANTRRGEALSGGGPTRLLRPFSLGAGLRVAPRCSIAQQPEN